MKFTKRRGLVALGIVASLVIAGSAIAYWTGSGSGGGEATVGSGNGVTLASTVTAEVVPGVATPVTFTSGNTGTSAVMVGTISLAGITADAGHSACDVADFSMADVPENHSVPAGATAEALPTDGSLVYANTGVNQDPCKGATLTLSLTSD